MFLTPRDSDFLELGWSYTKIYLRCWLGQTRLVFVPVRELVQIFSIFLKIYLKNDQFRKSCIIIFIEFCDGSFSSLLTDTGEDSKLVDRRKRPKVDTLFSSLFSDASARRVWLSTESKILASTFGRFRLYRLSPRQLKLFLSKVREILYLKMKILCFTF